MARSREAPPRPVLVVEDDPDIRDSVVELLRTDGYMTLEADNGQAALTVLRLTGARPCLIILDLAMPIMDGRTFRERLQRERPDLSDVPVVVSSAFTHAVEKMGHLAVAAYLTKPVDPNRLLALVERHCDRAA